MIFSLKNILEPTYLIIFCSYVIDWLLDSTNAITATILGALTVVYMAYKVYDIHLTVKEKKNKLKNKDMS